MIDIKELLLDMVRGFIRLFIVIGVCLLAMSMMWGILSAILTIVGSIKFQWWYIPCWVLIVCVLAGCLGQDWD